MQFWIVILWMTQSSVIPCWMLGGDVLPSAKIRLCGCAAAARFWEWTGELAQTSAGGSHVARELTGSSRVNPAARQHRGAAGVFVAPRLFCRSCGVMVGAAGLSLCPESAQSTSGKAAALPVLETLLRQVGLQHLQAGFAQSSCVRWTWVAPDTLLVVETQVVSRAQEHPGRAAPLHSRLKGLEAALESLLQTLNIIRATKG